MSYSKYKKPVTAAAVTGFFLVLQIIGGIIPVALTDITIALADIP